MKRLLLTALLSAGLAVPGAADVAGSDPFQFLMLDGGARASGLGGAYTALASDAGALHYNPAGLGFARRYEAAFTHNDYIRNLTQEYGGVCTPQGFGIDFNYLSYDKAPKTTLDNPSGAGLGVFTSADLAIGLGYGRALLDNLAVGASYKYARERIDTSVAEGHAFDGGVLFVPSPGLTLGFAVQNLGPRTRYQGMMERLPLHFRWGAAYAFTLKGMAMTASVDGMKHNSGEAGVATGIEAVVYKRAVLRIGYSSRNDGGPGLSAGAGFVSESMSADYAVAPYGALGWSHRATLTLRWSGPGRRRPVKPVEARGGAPKSAGQAPGGGEAGPSASDLLYRADILIQSGAREEADVVLERAGQLMGETADWRRAELQRLQGDLAMKREDPGAACGLYEAALKSAKSAGVRGSMLAGIYAGLGLCSSRSGKMPEAVSYLKKGLREAPSKPTRQAIEEELKRIESK